jgi:hypothetical protein
LTLNSIIFRDVEIFKTNNFFRNNFFLKENTRSDGIFGNLLFFEMELSKLINYLTNMLKRWVWKTWWAWGGGNHLPT